MIRNSRRVVAFAFAGAVAIAPVISGCGAGTEPQSAAPTRLTEGVNAAVPEGQPTSQVDIRNMFLLGPRPDQLLGAGSSVPVYATLINQVKGRQDRLVGVTSPQFAQARITGNAVTLPPAQPNGTGTPVTLIGRAPAAPTATATPRPTGSASPSPTGTATATPTASPTATPTPTGAAQQPTEVPVQPGGSVPMVILSGLNPRPGTIGLLGGEHIQVRLQFEHAGTILLTLPVVVQQGEYGSYPAASTGVPAPGSSPSPATPTPTGEHN